VSKYMPTIGVDYGVSTYGATVLLLLLVVADTLR